MDYDCTLPYSLALQNVWIYHWNILWFGSIVLAKQNQTIRLEQTAKKRSEFFKILLSATGRKSGRCKHNNQQGFYASPLCKKGNCNTIGQQSKKENSYSIKNKECHRIVTIAHKHILVVKNRFITTKVTSSN